MQGIVVKSTGSWYLVRNGESAEIITCRIRGKFRLSDVRSTNPVAVGDHVQYRIETDTNGTMIGVITAIKKRDNYIIRKSNKLSSHFQIIASNMDLVLPVFTLVQPYTSLGFLDRILITAEAYHIPVLILFNKIDLLSETEHALLEEIKHIYQNIGYDTLEISAKDNVGMTNLNMFISNKTSLICGHSGTGKSTIINNLNPELNLKTGNISDKFLKGKHTTTFAEMYFIDDNTHIIDTPGIRDFGVIDIDKSELKGYFPEFKHLAEKCRFNNCLHINEPDCAVIEQVKQNNISLERYNSYLSIMNDENIFE
ncbi:MAG: ribosome small subunit-dependent GTPase A [Bacteroidia bacterium]|nr:ribosome small subunit-dependent GTPase A [Bacteroidia bacterium]